MRFLKPLLLVAVLAAAAAGLAWYWHRQSVYPSTEDAYVQANILTISPLVAARVTEVRVAEGDRVEAGAVMVALDDRALRAAVDAAAAQLDLARQSAGAAGSNVAAASADVDAARAGLADAEAGLARVRQLFERGDMAQAALDTAQSARDQALARVAQAEAALAAARERSGEPGADNAAVRAAAAALTQAELALDHATITAPVAGWVANLSLRPGDVVAPGQPLFSLVEDGDWWVDANFRETDLDRIRPGQPVRIAVDMYPGLDLAGEVAVIGAGSGAVFSLLPPQNASGNWVKVTQRFPVRIALTPPEDPAFRLRVGASVTARVDTTALDAGGR
ncbi:HlyD family secretion protein [Roseibacterium sp. SDUM158016]|jgi:membrane fusion protein (multidrug efflux system)|uniref:HlyD family secretion protein n=1 Tax=Roseicyclus sediminis TaxID=2980997 RepID=UPI0021D34D39|nr:HlyD family secretion protein [Roseibacterium sp. SDUM158016]MCU4654791.1 HlyD family secretion protein [Roseibacterium sp. SDUM158016]